MEPQGWGRPLRYAHLGIQFGIIVVALFLGGHFLDNAYKTTPLWTLLGLALGFGAGMYHLVRDLQRIEEQRAAERGEGSGGSGRESEM